MSTHVTIPMARLIELETAEHDRDILRIEHERLRAEVEALRADAERWRGLYRRAVNEANGLTDYVEDRPELYRAEKRLAAIEAEARAAIDAAKEQR